MPQICSPDEPDDLARRLFELLARILRDREADPAEGKEGHAMDPSALVNEAWIKLFGRPRSWGDQSRFLCAVTLAMRNILVDHAKRMRAQKSDDAKTGSFDGIVRSFERRGLDLVKLGEAVDALAAEHPQMAQYVDLRLFGGRTNDEAARLLSISGRSGARMWSFAIAWLQQRMAS